MQRYPVRNCLSIDKKVKEVVKIAVKYILILVLIFNMNVKVVIDMKISEYTKSDLVESVVEPADLGLLGRGEA